MTGFLQLKGMQQRGKKCKKSSVAFKLFLSFVLTSVGRGAQNDYGWLCVEAHLFQFSFSVAVWFMGDWSLVVYPHTICQVKVLKI